MISYLVVSLLFRVAVSGRLGLNLRQESNITYTDTSGQICVGDDYLEDLELNSVDATSFCSSLISITDATVTGSTATAYRFVLSEIWVS